MTDNGRVFTARFGRGTGEVLFDRLLTENGVRHLPTAPRSPTTTGKVERFRKTLRSEFLAGRVFASAEAAQEALDAWVESYNSERPQLGDLNPRVNVELLVLGLKKVAELAGQRRRDRVLTNCPTRM